MSSISPCVVASSLPSLTNRNFQFGSYEKGTGKRRRRRGPVKFTHCRFSIIICRAHFLNLVGLDDIIKYDLNISQDSVEQNSRIQPILILHLVLIRSIGPSKNGYYETLMLWEHNLHSFKYFSNRIFARRHKIISSMLHAYLFYPKGIQDKGLLAKWIGVSVALQSPPLYVRVRLVLARVRVRAWHFRCCQLASILHTVWFIRDTIKCNVLYVYPL